MDTQTYWQIDKLPQFEPLSHDVHVDVVVIGGGLTGITAAYLLKKAGAKVALLERQRCAHADTGHTTAHLTYVTDARLNHLVKNFGKDAAKAFWEAGTAGIDQISEIVRPLVQRIESSTPITKDHYDQYMLALSQIGGMIKAGEDKKVYLAIGVAMTRVGGNRAGIQAALRALGHLG